MQSEYGRPGLAFGVTSPGSGRWRCLITAVAAGIAVCGWAPGAVTSPAPEMAAPHGAVASPLQLYASGLDAVPGARQGIPVALAIASTADGADQGATSGLVDSNRSGSATASFVVSPAAIATAAGAETAPARGLDVFGSVPVATSSRFLHAMVDRVFAVARDWQAPTPCREPTPVHECPDELPAAWHDLLEDLRRLAPTAMLQRIDREVNARIRYRSDEESYGQGEHWARARETLRSGSGDCEDLAILKMWMLARAGLPLDDMFVLVVRSAQLATQHAVLVVRIGDDAFVLDNLADRVASVREITHYTPVFSVNPKGIWLHGFTREKRMAAMDGRGRR